MNAAQLAADIITLDTYIPQETCATSGVVCQLFLSLSVLAWRPDFNAAVHRCNLELAV